MKRLSFVAASLTLSLATAAAFAGQLSSFPNLESAAKLMDQSAAKIQEARKDNRDQFGGHAERALALLQQARQELDAAAMYREGRH